MLQVIMFIVIPVMIFIAGLIVGVSIGRDDD